MARRFGKQESGAWIELTGLVTRLLADDGSDSGHQRFVLDLRDGQTLLVAHNVEVCDVVPLALGDRISVRGLYEWNELGGMVHWTHRDPMDKVDGGFIRHRNREYR